jgi:type I restriction enzyme, S subunit
MVSVMEKQLIPEGYKQTEVGVIPTLWGVQKIAEMASVASGGTPNRENKNYWDGDIPWVTTSLIDGEVITCANEFITEAGLKNSATKWFNKNTILMAMYGQGKTRGKVGLLGINATINQACAGINPNGDVDVHFFFHYLKSQYDSIRELSNAGGQENLSGSIIKSINIPLPPKKEQTAIANVLSDVDALIAALEKLINKKNTIKTAAMQQLLTGKKRLPPFDQLNTGYKQTELGKIPGDWDIRLLKNISPAISVGLVINPSSYFEGKGTVPMLVGSTVKENKIFWEKANCISEESNRKIPASRLREGDLVTVRVGEPGVTAVIPPELNDCNCASMMIIRKATSFNSTWLCFVMNSPIGILQIKNVQYGTAQKQFNISDALNFYYPFPSLPEQTAIANVLSDMDKDLEALHQRLHKTQQIKQGMMQELLTGKTRLV